MFDTIKGASILAMVVLFSAGNILAQEPSAEEELHVHRLKSSTTAPYDAFTYLNRVATAPGEDEPPAEFAGIVLYSRLPNVEGRMQLKVVEGFDRAAYLGYKSFMRAWPEPGNAVGNCVVCHTPATFGNDAKFVVDESGEAKVVPSLRNTQKSAEELKTIIQQKVATANRARADEIEVDESYKMIELTADDVDNLVAFVQSLVEVPEADFRDLIVNATILDTSDMM